MNLLCLVSSLCAATAASHALAQDAPSPAAQASSEECPAGLRIEAGETRIDRNTVWCSKTGIRVLASASIRVAPGRQLVFRAPYVEFERAVTFDTPASRGSSPVSALKPIKIEAARVFGVENLADALAGSARTDPPAEALAAKATLALDGETATTTAVGRKLDETARVTMTISGGISLGAYEAGYNWAFVRKLRVDEPLTAGQTPRRLAAVSGASAGAINTLLTAIAWCMDDNAVAVAKQKGDGATAAQLEKILAAELAPEGNLFWRTWVPIGFDRLFPGRRSCGEYRDAIKDARVCDDDAGPVYAADDGLFTRKAFHAIQSDIQQYVSNVSLFRDCALPIGLPVTRAVPESAGVDGLETPVDRFAVALMAKRAEKGPTRDILGLEFQQHATECSYVGPYLHPVTDAGGRVAFGDVVSLVEASSAFPIAFGPKKLRYLGDVESDGHRGQSKSHRDQVIEDQFIDGGVFDNIPLALALSLVAPDDGNTSPRVAGSPATRCPAPPKSVELVAIDPGRRRHAIAPDLKLGGMPRRGLASIPSLAQSFVSVSRKYELQALARYILMEGKGRNGNDQDDADAARRVRVSTRYYPLFGELLGGFGAFFSEQFRKHDYYVGIYDAAWDMAREVCKVGDVSRLALGQVHCIVQSVQRTHDALSLTGNASYVVRHLLDSEVNAVLGSEADPLLATTIDAPGTNGKRLTAKQWVESPVEHDAVITALLEANDRYLMDALEAYASGPDAYRRFESRDHLGALITRLQETTGDYALELNVRSPREDPTRWYMPQLESLIERLRELDRADGTRGAVVAGTAAEVVVRSYDGLGKVGFHLDPSTVPDGHLDALRAVAHLLPNGAGYVPDAIDVRWTPTWAVAEHVALVWPASLRFPASAEGYFGARFGVGMALRTNWLPVTGVEATAGWWPQFGDATRRLDAEMTVGVAGDKLRFGVSVFRDLERGEWHVGPVALASDLNGLFYWMIQSVR